MTNLMQRIAHTARKLDLAWDEGDIERTWRRLVRKRRRRALRWTVLGTGAAALSLVAVLAAIEGRRTSAERAAEQVAEHSTKADAVKPSEPAGALRLADGSRVFPLQAQSAVKVTQESARQTTLEVTRGGARFEVVPNPGRTFSVAAGGVTVTALGTVFTVDRVADRVGVVVTRGEVLVDWRLGTRHLRAGEDGWFPPLVIAAPEAREHAAVAPVPSSGRARARTAGAETPPPPAADAAAARADASAAALLLAAADEARLAGRSEEGATLLQRVVREHAGDPRAPVAAFSLGRLLLRELRRPEEAARAFASARALAPTGPLAEDALAREVEAWTAAGAQARARARADEYLRLYPAGRRAQAVSRLVEP
jgi:transmembrane sensor